MNEPTSAPSTDKLNRSTEKSEPQLARFKRMESWLRQANLAELEGNTALATYFIAKLKEDLR